MHTLHRIVGLGMAVALGSRASAQCEQAKLVDIVTGAALSGPHPLAVAVSGDGSLGVAGLPRQNDDAGSVRVFERVGSIWSQTAEVSAADAESAERLGFSVALSADGGTMLAGAIQAGDKGPGSGAAFVFVRDERGTWSQQAELRPPQGEEQDYFGWSVALSSDGDAALVGMPGTGSVWVFHRDGRGRWIESARLEPSSPGGFFGSAVALSGSGERAVVGAYAAGDFGPSSGSAYVFARDGSGDWIEEAKLLASDGAGGDYFGRSVSLSADGDVAAVGAHRKENKSGYAGAVYVFRRRSGTWIEEAKLEEADEGGPGGPEFGRAVALARDGGTLVVGAPEDSERWGNGAIYAYAREGARWTRLAKLMPADEPYIDQLGFAVALSTEGSVLLAGTPHLNRSAAFAFSLDGADCNSNGICDGRDLAVGTSADVNENGAPDECEVAAPYCQPEKVLAGDTMARDGFGRSVSASGERALIGAFGDDPAAYVFCRTPSGWVERQKLYPEAGHEGNGFGRAVALDGDFAVVGAAWDDDRGESAGAVYVFRRSRSGWVGHQKLYAGDAAPGDRFGEAVAICGDLIVVGAPEHDQPSTNGGAAFLFGLERSVWVEQHKLAAFDAGYDDRFGIAVVCQPDVVVVGAPLDDDDGTSSGSAYVFVRDGPIWTVLQKLRADDGSTADYFGTGLALSGDRLAIGASGADAVYVFREVATWTQEQKLVAVDGAPLWYLAISGQTIVAGAPSADEIAPDSGSAYEFRFDGSRWAEVRKIVPADAGVNHQFGGSVALLGKTALIGAPTDNHAGLYAGSVYSFDLSGPCQGDLNGDGFVDAIDVVLLLGGWGPCPGPPDFCSGDLDGDGDVATGDLLVLLANWR